MKKFMAGLGALLIGICIMLSGCSSSITIQNSSIIKNGGTAVKTTNYFIYANAYKSNSGLTAGDNDMGDGGYNSLYLAELTEGELSFDDEGVLQDTKLIVSKITASENGVVFLYNSRLFFTSPNIHRTSTNATKFDCTSLFQANVDGSGVKEILTTENGTGKIQFYEINDKGYIVVADGEKLSRYEITSNSLSKVEIEDEMASFVLDKKGSRLYYTKAREDTNTGNLLYVANIETGAKSLLDDTVGTVYTLNSSNDGVLVYTKTTAQESTAYYYSYDFPTAFSANKSMTVQDQIQLYSSDSTTFVYYGNTPAGAKGKMCYIYQGGLFIKNYSENCFTPIVTSADSCGEPTSILFTSGDYCYFGTATGIYRVDYEGNIKTLATPKSFISTHLDFDGQNLYFFGQDEDNISGNNYLYMVNTFETNPTAKLLSVIDENDLPAEEDEE